MFAPVQKIPKDLKVRESTKFKALKADIDLQQEKLDALEKKLALEIVEQRIKCPYCASLPKLSECTYIQTYGYREPYGCTGGGYHFESEGQFRCPRCKNVTRLYESPDVVKHKKFFGEVEKDYSK